MKQKRSKKSFVLNNFLSKLFMPTMFIKPYLLDQSESCKFVWANEHRVYIGIIDWPIYRDKINNIFQKIRLYKDNTICIKQYVANDYGHIVYSNLFSVLLDLVHF